MKKAKLFIVLLSMLCVFGGISPSVTLGFSEESQAYAATKYSYAQHFPKGQTPPDKRKVYLTSTKWVWSYLLRWNKNTRTAIYYYYK